MSAFARHLTCGVPPNRMWPAGQRQFPHHRGSRGPGSGADSIAQPAAGTRPAAVLQLRASEQMMCLVTQRRSQPVVSVCQHAPRLMMPCPTFCRGLTGGAAATSAAVGAPAVLQQRRHRFPQRASSSRRRCRCWLSRTSRCTAERRGHQHLRCLLCGARLLTMPPAGREASGSIVTMHSCIWRRQLFHEARVCSRLPCPAAAAQQQVGLVSFHISMRCPEIQTVICDTLLMHGAHTAGGGGSGPGKSAAVQATEAQPPRGVDPGRSPRQSQQ